MTKEDAANILDLKTRPEALADFVGPELAGMVHQAMIMGAEALRSPWVRTVDRLPTEADADELGRVLLMCVVDKWCNCVPVSTIDADEEWFWMPVPLLPEVTP